MIAFFLIGLFGSTTGYIVSVVFSRTLILWNPYFDVLYSEECQTKTLSVVCCEMFAFFKLFTLKSVGGKALS